MTYAINTRVQWRQDVGVVRRVLGGGTVHEVEFASGQVIPCLGDVLKEAPPNVLVFRKRPNPYGEMYEND